MAKKSRPVTSKIEKVDMEDIATVIDKKITELEKIQPRAVNPRDVQTRIMRLRAVKHVVRTDCCYQMWWCPFEVK